MADNVVANPGSGGAQFRSLSDGTNEWPVGVCSYVTGGSAGAWTIAPVDITHGLPVQPMTGATWNAAQSGTWTVNQGGSNWSVNLGQIAGSGVTTAGQTGTLAIGGAVATNTAVSSATNPLLIAGSDYGGTPKVQTVKVDSSGNAQVAVTNTPAVSQSGTWTVTANAGTGSFTVAQATAANLNATVVGTGTFAVQAAIVSVSATGSAVPADADYSGLNVAGTLRGHTGVNPSGSIYAAQVDVASIAGSTIAQGHGTAAAAIRVELPTDGTGQVAISGSVAVTGTFWQATQPVSGTVTANQGGSNWSVNVAQWAGGNTTNAGQTGAVQVGGAVATNTAVSSATYPILIAGSDYGGTPKIQSWKVDSSGNGQVAVTNTPNIGTVTTVTTVSAVTAITNALPAGTNTIGNVVPVAGTSGGATPYVLQASAASNNATNVKASAGTLYGLEAFNLAAYPVFIKFYNKASAPTPGTDTVVKSIMVPCNSTAANGAGVVAEWPEGIAFGTGISFAIVKGQANSDNTSVAAGDCTLNLNYA